MLWILVRALLCIAAINASYVHTYFVSDGDSPGVLQDIVDESLYLRVAIDHGHLLPQESIYREHAKSLPLSDLLTHWRPDQTYSHFLIGRFAVALGLRLQELNIALDIVSGVLAYLTLYLCFRALLGKQHTLLAELATVIFLCFPWFASPENWVEFLSLWPSITATVGPVEHTTLPIQEGVESQLSCVWFALTLLSLILASKGGSPANRKMAVVGALTGLGLYTYTLEWIAATFLIPLLTCAMIFTYHHSPNILQVAKTLSIWLICNLAAALPGMIQIHAVRAEKSIFINSPSLYKTAYYIPIEWLVFIILGTFMVRWTRTRWSLTSRHLLALCVATSIAEICILNIQPIVGIATVGLYIVVGFTRPLLSALIVAFVFLRFSYNPQYRQIFRALIVFFIVAAGYRMRHVSAISRPEADQLTPLVSFVKAQISQDSVIAMITYHRPFQSSTKEWEWRWQPNVVAALTRTHLLKEALGLEWGALSPEETISRELALGVIFTGEPKLIRGCAEDLILSPKRLFFLQWIPIQLTRKFNCEQSRDIIRDMSPCEAFQLFAVDYVIWEREFQLLKPAYLEHAGELVWTSPNNDIEVIKIDSEKAANYLCTTKPHV